MSQTGRCPHCGSVPSATDGLEPLYREVRRIREIAEARVSGDAGPQIAEDAAHQAAEDAAHQAAEDAAHQAAEDAACQIAELTRQVEELRATVARLRGRRSTFLAATSARETDRRVS